MKLGERIRRVRENIGITQKELARRLGTTSQNISQYERSLRNPKSETLSQIAQALEMPTEILTGAQPFPDPFLEYPEIRRDIVERIYSYLKAEPRIMPSFKSDIVQIETAVAYVLILDNKLIDIVYPKRNV